MNFLSLAYAMLGVHEHYMCGLSRVLRCTAVDAARFKDIERRWRQSTRLQRQVHIQHYELLQAASEEKAYIMRQAHIVQFGHHQSIDSIQSVNSLHSCTKRFV
jgi:hypothetical protein